MLSARYEDPAVAREEVGATYALLDASGSAAVEGSRVVGYLLGAPKNESWGQNIWVETSGHAVEEPETARALYAVAATRWLAEGRNAHYALLPSHDTRWCRRGSGWRSDGSTRTRFVSRRRPARSVRAWWSASRPATRSPSSPDWTWC